MKFVNKLLHKKIIYTAIGLVIIVGIVMWYRSRIQDEKPVFIAVQVKRGDIVSKIGATGTVEPEEVIDLGAQVAGRIDSFGTDKNGKTIDYGSTVEKEMVLAKIDDSLYAADVAQADASLKQSQAGVKVAQANLEQLKAKFDQAQRDWVRAQKLGPSEALAQISYDAYESAYEIAKADITVGQAAILQAEASVAQAQAVLQKAQQNLSYCTIRSPVDGIIIDRRVNTGQTVVSSLNAPSLFLIAKDLKRMQVWISVNEAYIADIHPGQPVKFTVDAIPGEVFSGEVGKIRLNASMTQNVVTYVVEVVTDNSSGKLLPYLTANADFEIARSDNVLFVPNSALRWMPQEQQIEPKSRPEVKANKTQISSEVSQSETGSAERTKGMVWIQEGDYVRPVNVFTGLNDGLNVEVQSDELKEGVEVVIAVQAHNIQTGTTNPFTPQLRRSRSSSNQ
jgi:HlyD family secretion protein